MRRKHNILMLEYSSFEILARLLLVLEGASELGLGGEMTDCDFLIGVILLVLPIEPGPWRLILGGCVGV